MSAYLGVIVTESGDVRLTWPPDMTAHESLRLSPKRADALAKMLEFAAVEARRLAYQHAIPLAPPLLQQIATTPGLLDTEVHVSLGGHLHGIILGPQDLPKLIARGILREAMTNQHTICLVPDTAPLPRGEN